MNTIASLFSPTLLGVFSCLTLGVAAVLFMLARRGENGVIELRAPLSWSDPVEVRLVLYLLLGAMSGVTALVLRLLFVLPSPGSFGSWLLLVLVLLCFLFNLAFFYAAMGSLLQGAVGTRGRPPFWFTPLLGFLDGAIMDAGDLLAGIVFTPAPSTSRRRRRRYEYEDEYEDDYDAPPRRRPQTRVRTAAPRPARPRPVYETYEDEQEEAPAYQDIPVDYPELNAEDGAPVRPLRRRRGAPPRDIPRERLELALQEYEATLSPTQREKLRELRTLIDAIRQYA
jgi:hypothetical protein